MTAPAPRLEFRWRSEPESYEEKNFSWGDDITAWFCDYGLVLPLKETDIRAEGPDGSLGAKKEIFVKINTSVFGSIDPPEERQIPYRDSAHALWDGDALGGDLPIWVLGLSGEHHDATRELKENRLTQPVKRKKTPAEEAAYKAGRQDAQLLANLALADRPGWQPVLTDDEATPIPDFIERQGREHDRMEILPDDCVVVYRGGNITCLLPIQRKVPA